MGPIRSSYFQSLDYSAQKHYLTKLKVDGHDLKDPYDIPDELWLDDPSRLNGQRYNLEISTLT